MSPKINVEFLRGCSSFDVPYATKIVLGMMSVLCTLQFSAA